METAMVKKVCLASDNWAPAHLQIMQAIAEANSGDAPAYGGDLWTQQAEDLICESFRRECKVLIVPTGTGVNVLGLKLMCRRHESVICTDVAHLYYGECGAAESIVGCRLLTVPHVQGKLTPERALHAVQAERYLGKHSTSPRVLSITQPTELGTVYSLGELRRLSALCREEKLLFHVDGSRLYDAVVYLGVSLHEMAVEGQFDVLSLGGTKNGLMGAEALLIFDAELQEGSDHYHKQTLQLVSKMRYLAAQYVALFKQDLWQTLARQANQRAQEIASLISAVPSLSLSYPVETNQIFFRAPAPWLAPIQEAIASYLWNPSNDEIRFVTSWKTAEEEVNAVRALFEELGHS
jgi:threonine aldolase